MSQFSIDVSRWVEKVKDRQDLVVRKIAIEAFRRVILKTPVDTGRARGNWQAEIGGIPNTSVVVNDIDGTMTVNKAAAVAMGVKAGDVIYLANNVVYIGALERGHSKQAPAGMVAVTVAEFNQFTEKAVSETKQEIR